MKALKAKEAALKQILHEYSGLVVAFSGGVDSSVLLAAARQVLPREKVLAVTAYSPTYPACDLRLAKAIARQLATRHLVVASREFENPRFVANPPDRCYHCKQELFRELVRIARHEGLAMVVDGTNYDDRRDFRPGSRAALECGVKSPLFLARLTKQELRLLARKYRLPNWNRAPGACLASRVPYGTPLDIKLLARIDAAERLLLRHGFRTVRVRDHSPVARIELDPEDFARIIRPKLAGQVVRGLSRLGYRYVTLDLAGYRTGSMNFGRNRAAQHRS